MSPKTGRPRSESPKSTRLEMRVTPEEKDEIMNFSREHKISLLELLRLGIETVKKK